MKKIGIVFIFIFLIAIFIGATGFVIVNYTNSRTYEGTVTAHYKDDRRSNTYYYVLDDNKTFKNSTLLFKNTTETVRIQEKVEVGQRVRVNTIGIKSKWLNTYPIIYQLEVLNEWIYCELFRR